MRGLLRAYYWMDESLQNGLSDAGMGTRTRTQTMILINVTNSKKKTLLRRYRIRPTSVPIASSLAKKAHV